MPTLRMRRILLLITDLEIGGTPTVVRELAVRLHSPPGVQVEVACLSKWGPVADQLRAAGIEVTALGAKGAWDLRILTRFVKLAREHRIDTVFSFLMHANVVAAMGSLFLRGVRFLQSIQTTQPKPKWHWKLQAVAQEMAAKIVVPSESVGRVAREWAGVPSHSVEVIPNAVGVECLRGMGVPPVHSRLKPQAHGRDARATIRIGFLGRLDSIKRVTDLIEAMQQLDIRFELHIFGEGADRPRIEFTRARLNLRDRVTLHGAVAMPQDAIAHMDVLVLPSEAEGFGLVLIEAMAAKVPVVATDVPGIRDVVRNEQTGLLVPVARPDLLARAIQRITDDCALRNRLVDAAFLDVQARFSWPAVLKQYRCVLDLEAQ
jgi:glycosyltransferase involved in cell wall biosynthesis